MVAQGLTLYVDKSSLRQQRQLFALGLQLMSPRHLHKQIHERRTVRRITQIMQRLWQGKVGDQHGSAGLQGGEAAFKHQRLEMGTNLT